MSFPSEGRGHKFESCRARQWINSLQKDESLRCGRSYHIATKRSNFSVVHAARNSKSIGLRFRLSRRLSKSNVGE
jgi:hypothetical protein